MVTFDDLRNARFDPLRSHADAWSRTMRQLDDLVRDFELGVCGATETAGWHGDAAGLANPELEAALRRLRIAALETRGIAAELDFAVDALAGAQTRLFGEIYAALTDGVSVTGAGDRFTVAEAVPPTAPRDQRQQAAVQSKIDGYVRRFQAILDEAATADGLHAAALAKLSAAEVAAGDGAALQNAQDDLARTFSAMTPAQNAAWWASLTEAQRQAYLYDHPQQIGGMDGLPATVRNQANQIALSSRLAELGPLVHGGTATTAEQREWDNLQKISQVMATNQKRPTDGQLMLLKFGNSYYDGQVVMSVGNPDTAANTVVQVPGARVPVAGKLEEQITRLTDLHRTANGLTKDTPGDVAAVLWLDYDSPEMSWNGSALTPARAKEGADRFDRFVDGMRVTGPPNQHLTASGHSYGSSVIAYAARDGNGIAVDDIVFEGSPGVHLDTAQQLRIDPGHVWVGMAADDTVAPAGSFFHGRLPTDPEFGAVVYATNQGGHDSYWDMKDTDNDGTKDTPDTSLLNQARIAMGRYDEAVPDRPTT
ncbi:MAG: hypothetical protein HOV68_32665 [Streptomycetaceae bacterium]|nr:hypothetical protein [Streptomycetaceae bacterium]